MELEHKPKRTPRNWLPGLLFLVLAGTLGVIAFDVTPEPIREWLGFAANLAEAPSTAPGQVAESPSNAQGGAAASQTTTLPSPTPPPRIDHYWIERPIGPEGYSRVDYTYPYGSRGDGTLPVHRGVEFVNPSGTPILAVAPGVIVFAGADDEQIQGARLGYYGLVVIEQLDRDLDGLPVFITYGHLSEIEVAVGDRVETGQVIGKVGMTGIAIGPHLHMEVRVGANDFGSTVNSELWLRPMAGEGTVAGLVCTTDDAPLAGVDLRVVHPSQPNVPVREITTYPSLEVNPDPYWGENFVCGDLDEGEYLLQITRSGLYLSVPFPIEAGQTTWLRVQLPS